MHLTPDHIVFFQWRFIHLNATIFCTWFLIALLTTFSWLITRRLAGPEEPRSRWQNAIEVIVETIRAQISVLCPTGADTYLPFVGSLFLFIVCSSLLEIVPGWHAPTASLSTTAALAISVGVAVPVFGVISQGFVAYFRHYLRPTVIMLPFHLMSETSRNLALAVRLFGNIMSGAMVAGMLLAIAPFFLPRSHADTGSAHGCDSGVCLRHSGHGLHCRRRSARTGRINDMDRVIMIGIASIVGAAFCMAIGAIAPALGEGKAVAQALAAIAQQPDESATISRTLLIGLAMIESIAIYCFVIAIVLIFANPFWNYVIAKAGG